MACLPRRVRFALLLLLLLRGVATLCAVPPMAGWDEYQHVACVAHWVAHRSAPEPGRAVVAPAVLRRVIGLPQPDAALEHLGPAGGVGYAAFWARGDAAQSAPVAPAAVPLYQAQHGPLYYRLAAPLFVACGGIDDLRSAVAALRIANLVLTLAAIWLALCTALAAAAPGTALPAALVVVLHPLLLLNGGRVANDALGVLLATLAIAWSWPAAQATPRPWWRCLAIGAAGGAAILAKSVHLALVPFLVVGLALDLRRARVSARAACAALGLLLGGLLLVAGPELLDHLRRFGLLVPAQEALRNQAAGRGLPDLLAAAAAVPWLLFAARMLVVDTTWVGVWLLVPLALPLLLGATLLTGLGWLGALRRLATPGPLRAALLAGCFLATLAWHAVQGQMAWGQPTTNAWYGAAAWPWLLAVIVVPGLLAWPRVGRVLAILFAVVLIAAELWGTWAVIVPECTGRVGAALALRRLASLQPAWLPPAAGLAAATAALAIAVVLLLAVARPRHSSQGR